MSEEAGHGEAGHTEKTKTKPVCRFYNTKKGCRAGNSCRFQHASQDSIGRDAATQTQHAVSPESQQRNTERLPSPKIAAPKAEASRVVQRPTPSAQMADPRAFQMMQIQRRFKPTVSEREGKTLLSFKLKPTDPDFAYDIEELECELTVPKSYPASGKPTLSVQNKDIPRGFQINIEQGFDKISEEAPNAYLLGLLNRLDRDLECILSGKKADTITIVSNRAPSPRAIAAAPTVQETPIPPKIPDQPPEPTPQQLEDARTKRQSDARQLEARFKRLPHFAKASDGLTYTLPLDSPKRSTWPANVQPLRSFQLKLPEQYPLVPLEIRLFSDVPEAKAIEKAFKERSNADSKATITQHVNYLSQHVKEMSVVAHSPERMTKPEPQKPGLDKEEISTTTAASTASQTTSQTAEWDDSHIKHIPRPPEWDVQNGSKGGSGSGSDSDTDSYGSDEDGSAVEDGKLENSEQTTSTAPAERGILLSLPRLELHGIELLELSSLNLTVKCERCKDTIDIERLRTSPENSKMREVSCKKCATTLAIRFRADMIHANSLSAGYLDLDGCTIVDLLPSNFSPTCSECSTQFPAPGIVAVRGDNSITVCRECHTKMSVRIVEVKFLLVSASALRASRAPGRRQPRENLGIVAGTELPNRGRCRHYKKSYRWFRFSCCAKVYPCDRCHDEQNDHAVEHANRMLCGYCSREQNYRPEDCGICHSSMTASKGRGFWEGGKGTRDPARMSRKDPRKFRNRNKTKHIKE